MKMQRYIVGLFAGLAISLSALAQNSLTVSDISIQPYSSVQLPIMMNNTQSVVAMQFTLTIPHGAALSSEVQLSERATNHRATVRQFSDTTYMIMVFSPSNDAFIGRSGQMLSIELWAYDSFAEGQAYDIKLSNVILSARDGSNICSGWQDGKMHIRVTPDLYIHDVQADRSDYMPGEQMTVSWITENVGGDNLRAGWNAYIYLVNDAGEEALIGVLRKDLQDGVFAPSATEAQTVVCQLSEWLGLDGAASVRVSLDADYDSGETREHVANNVATSAASVNMGVKMYLDGPTRIEEEGGGTEHYYLSRSGSNAADETFSLQVYDSRLAVPATVVIPQYSAGAYFSMNITPNEATDNDSITTLYIASDKYGELYRTLIIDDDVLPSLHLSCDYSQITEGDAFQITITADRAPETDITLSILCSAQDRFEYPRTTVLSAGYTTVSFNVTAKENTSVEPDIDMTFDVLSAHFQSGRLALRLLDNDMPEFSFELSPLTVTESSGTQAISGYLTRETLFDREIIFQLSDNSDDRLIYSTYEITLPKNSRSARFTLGVMDNQDVDTTLDVTVKASVLMPYCWCRDTSAAGVRTQTIHILDDDGPALRLSVNSTMLLEGDEEGVILTVTRNTAPEGALTVTLSADNESGLTFDHTVTIPDGERSASVVVRAQANDISGDGRTIAFLAQTEGYSMGSTWLLLTDQTLPDAQICTIFTDTAAAVAGEEEIQLSIVVCNRGVANLPAGTVVKVYTLGDDRTWILQTMADIAPKQQDTIRRAIKLPVKPGTYELYAVVNETRRVEELLYTNNISETLSLVALPPFGATLQTDKAVYTPTQTMHITGQLTGTNIANRTIEFYAINYDQRYTQSVVTNADGSFALDYLPQIGLSGHFSLGVCKPGSGDDTEMTGVEVYGLRAAAHMNCYPIVDVVYTDALLVTNTASSALHNVTAHVDPESELSNIVSVQFEPTDLEGHESKYLSFSMEVSEASTGDDWIPLPIILTSDEGLAVTEHLYYYARVARAQLSVHVKGDGLNTSITEGTTRDVTIEILNEGAGATGDITFALPPYITTVTPSTLSSLNASQSTEATLRIVPNESFQLNMPVEGQLGINCTNGNGVAVPYRIEMVSGSTGTLTVDVCDQYTYYTDEAPHVQGASVVVRHPATGVVLAQGTTGADGHYTVELNAGYYEVTATADKHDSKTLTVLVSPDRDNLKVFNLNISAVTVDWRVEETEVDDEYEIVSTVTYETNVPMPVVILEMSQDSILVDSMRECEPIIIYAKIYNKGLIRADEVKYSIPVNDEELKYEILAYNYPFSLAAQDSVLIPIRVTKYGAECPKESSGYGEGTGGGGSGGGSGGGGGGGGAGGGGTDTSCNGCVITGWGGGGSGGGGGASGGGGSGGGGGASGGGSGGGDGGSGSGDGGSGGGGGASGGGGGDSGGGGGGSGGGGGGSGGGGGASGGGGGGGSIGTDDTYTKDCITYHCVSYKVKCGPDVKTERHCGGTLKHNCGNWPVFPGMPGNDGPNGGKTGSDEISTITFNEFGGQPMFTDNCDTCISRFKGDFKDCYETIITFIVPNVTPWGDNISGAINAYNYGRNMYSDGIYSSGLLNCLGSLFTPVDIVVTMTKSVWQCGSSMLNFCSGTTFDGGSTGGGGSGGSGGGGGPDFFSDLGDLLGAPRANNAPAPRRATSLNNGKDFSAYPSNIRAYIDRSDHAWVAVVAMYAIELEIYGDTAFWKMEPEEGQALGNYIKTWDGSSNDIWNYKPDSISVGDFSRFIDRLQHTLLNDTTDGNYIHWDKVTRYAEIYAEQVNAANELGYVDLTSMLGAEVNNLVEDFQEDPGDGVCASISLQFSQKAVFARQAFRGTLTVTNGHESLSMDSVVLTLKVINQQTGAVATQHEFQINLESLEGFTGNMNLEDGWSLAGNSTGVATVLFIPTKYAALTADVKYAFGGELSYKDPNTGLKMTYSLMPQILTVSPSPNLQLTYFMQRDILGDDALTEDEIEPMEEAEFALLINNIGNGDAKNMRIKTEQPQIVDNEKGLYITFQLTRSLHNGESVSFGLDGTITNNLGDIAAHTTDYVQWFLTSTLLGHFTNYNVSATHLTSYGNPDMSLLDTVTIHELIRSVEMPSGIAWLCNDIEDARDLPDALYGADGSLFDVRTASTAEITEVDVNHYQLSVNGRSGWMYGNVQDRTNGNQQLTRVVRASDGKELSLRNFWQTHVTLRDGKKPLYENKIHFLDSIASSDESYDLYFEDLPGERLLIDHIDGVPTGLSDSLVTALDVTFTKPVAAVSFTHEDLRLTRDGVAVDMSEVTVQAMSESVFHIDLSKVSNTNGYYVLEIVMNGIVDTEGYSGTTYGSEHRVFWSQYIEGLATGVESIQNSDVRIQKIIRDGQLIIIKDGVEYNVMGTELK